MSYDLKLTITAVDKASKQLKNIGEATDGLRKKFRGLGDVVKVAAGMLLRDFANSAVQTFKRSIELGGQIETLQNSFNALTKAQGATHISIEKLREATKGTVDDITLLQSANQALMLGLPTENLDQLFKSAMQLGHAMGIDTKAAVESLTVGLGRQSKQILDNLGVVFQASEAYAWYAKKIGVAAEDLDEAQKKQAWMQYAIQKVTERASELGDVTSETQLRQEQWNATITNMTVSIGNFLQPLGTVAPVMENIMQVGGPLIGTMLPQLIGKLGGLGGIAGSVTSGLGSMASMLGAAGPVGLAIMGAIAAGALLYTAWTQDWGGIRTTTIEALKVIGNAMRGFVDWIVGLWEGFCNTLKSIAESIWNFITGLFQSGSQAVQEEVEDLSQELVGESIWPEMLGAMVKETKDHMKLINKEWKNGIGRIGRTVKRQAQVSLRTISASLAVEVAGLRAARAPTTTTVNAPITVMGVQEEIAEYVRGKLVKDLQNVLIRRTSEASPAKKIVIPKSRFRRPEMTLWR